MSNSLTVQVDEKAFIYLVRKGMFFHSTFALLWSLKMSRKMSQIALSRKSHPYLIIQHSVTLPNIQLYHDENFMDFQVLSSHGKCMNGGC